MRVVIQVGHQPHGGAQGADINEAEINKAVADHLKPLSDKRVSYEFKRQRGTNLLAVIKALLSNKPDIVISLHCDAGSQSLHQASVYYWSADPKYSRNATSYELGGRLAMAVEKMKVAEHVILKSAPYAREGNPHFLPGILKNTAKKAAVLFEMGFISDIHTEHAMMTDAWQKNAATAIDIAVRSLT